MIINLLCFVLALAAQWSAVQTSGGDTNLRAISVVGSGEQGTDTTIWASGSKGALLRSVDSGKTWEQIHIADGAGLDFRGVQAFAGNVAYLMASGAGEKSGIFKTLDGGKTWTKQYNDARKEFFLDAIACVDSTNCFALSDPVDGKFLLIHTTDGIDWKEIAPDSMPVALPKEGAFAASNTSLIVYGEHELYFGTGGPAARVFHSSDGGKNWAVMETPIIHGKASQGIFSLARSGTTLVAVGGDYTSPEQKEGTAAYSVDQGKNWKLATNGPGGYRSAVVASPAGFISAGPTGEDVSKDGNLWEPAGSMNVNAIIFANKETWGVGPKGNVLRFAWKSGR
jgi:photosystem II stability/assembly factor-like uncharacterized protein